MQAVAAAWRGAARSTRGGVRHRDLVTVTLACLSGALFVPSAVGAGFFFVGVLRFMDDDLFWFFGMIVGLPLAFIVVTAGLLGMAAGVTVGAWLIAGRPLSRLAAASLAGLGILVGWTLFESLSPVSAFIGQATLVLAIPLLLLTLVPRRSEARRSSDPAGPLRDDAPRPSGRARLSRRRFVL